jgi:hypothetical protein
LFDRINRSFLRIFFSRLSGRKLGNPIACGESKKQILFLAPLL